MDTIMHMHTRKLAALIAEILTENITVGEGGRRYLHAENDKSKVTSRRTEPRQTPRK